MYELNANDKQILDVFENLKKDIEANSIDGLIIIKVPKNKLKELDIQAVFGGISQFEWVGMLDYVVDIVKGSNED